MYLTAFFDFISLIMMYFIHFCFPYFLFSVLLSLNYHSYFFVFFDSVFIFSLRIFQKNFNYKVTISQTRASGFSCLSLSVKRGSKKRQPCSFSSHDRRSNIHTILNSSLFIHKLAAEVIAEKEEAEVNRDLEEDLRPADQPVQK